MTFTRDSGAAAAAQPPANRGRTADAPCSDAQPTTALSEGLAQTKPNRQGVMCRASQHRLQGNAHRSCDTSSNHPTQADKPACRSYLTIAKDKDTKMQSKKRKPETRRPRCALTLPQNGAHTAATAGPAGQTNRQDELARAAAKDGLQVCRDKMPPDWERGYHTVTRVREFEA